MRAYPVLGVAVVAILIGSGLYMYTGGRTASPIAYEPQNQTPAAPAKENVSFRVLDSGTVAANAPERKNYAAYSQASFLKLWEMAHGTDKTSAPNVNFENDYVIGVFAGQRPTGGYSVAVTGVTDTGNTRTVSVTLTKSGAGCITNQMITRPFQIIVVPKSDAVLAHADAEVSMPCK